MGIHYFYTWLTYRYPLIKRDFNSKSTPQIDYLYLDLNGIIHKCAKDNSALFKDLLCGKKTEEIYVAILNYTNFIISLIKPKKGIMIAIDGVAPRAKMNNQRNRRFMASKTQHQVNDFLINTLKISPNIVYFKNNSISPGTEFMIELNRTIFFFIQRKIHEDHDWKDLEVVFSGGDVPGEGEHKILNYIRQNRQKPDFNIQDTHCIYGNDSDLVLLSLITHLPHVMLLREEFQPGKRTVINSATKRTIETQRMEVIYINMLREYFKVEFDCVIKDSPSNIEHIIDDFVLFSFFIGNDFLHQVYCMNTKMGIFDEFIEIMLEFYKTQKMFLTNKSVINWKSFYLVLKEFLPLQKKMIKTTIIDFNSRLSELHKNSFYSKLKKQKNVEPKSDHELNPKVKSKLKPGNIFEAFAKPNEQTAKVSKSIGKEQPKTSSDDKLVKGLMAVLNLKEGDNTVVDAFKSATEGKPKSVEPVKTKADDLITGLMNALKIQPTSEIIVQQNTNPIEAQVVDDDVEVEDPIEEFPSHGPVTINAINEEEFGKVGDEEGESENLEVMEELREEESKRYLEEFRSQYEKLVKARNLMESINEAIKNEGNYQEIYYKEYFGITKGLNVEISKICHNYLNGVDFVYKYYYCGCPSWSWYYKYHLSPLLFDLHDYLKKMFDNGQEINFVYEPSQPTDPYIQLLYILPNESLCLLPKKLIDKVLSPDSIIKHYYPINYDISPFDKHKDYTWLAIIEHIDDSLIEQFLKSINLKDILNNEELFRNGRGKDFVFRWNDKKEVLVVPCVSGFETVKAKISIEEIIIDSEFTTLANIIDYNSSHQKPLKKRFPSMFFSDKLVFRKAVKNRRYRYELVLTFETMKEMYRSVEELSKKIGIYDSKTSKNVYCDLISQQQFIFQRAEMISFNEKSGYLNDVLTESLEYLQSVGIFVPNEEIKKLKNQYPQIPVFFVSTPTFSTYEFTGLTLQKCSIKTESENPIPMVFFSCFLQESFPKLRESAVGNLKDAFQEGQICFNLQTGDLIKLLDVKINKEMPVFGNYEIIHKNDSTRNISLKILDEKLYLIDERLIKEFNLKVENLKILWVILDSIKILCDHSSHTTLVLGDGFEIGLNFINFLNRRPEDWKMVPDLIRIHYKYKIDAKKGPVRKNSTSPNECMFIWSGEGGKVSKYYNVYLTQQGYEAVKEFFNENKIIVDYLKANSKDVMFFDQKSRVFRYKTQFNASHIFRGIKSEDINIDLFKIYAEVLKKQHSNLMLLPSLGVSYSIDVVNNQLANFNLPKSKAQDYPLNPFYLMKYSAREDMIWPPFGTRPYYHEEGDRVAFVSSQHSEIKFGVLGTIIGVYKEMIEVLFDEAFIGATNLNGRCPNFRGKIVCVFDLFNLSKWSNIIVDFDDPPKTKKNVWKGDYDLDGLLKLIQEKQRSRWKN